MHGKDIKKAVRTSGIINLPNKCMKLNVSSEHFNGALKDDTSLEFQNIQKDAIIEVAISMFSLSILL